MGRIPGFVGPANKLQSVNADAEDTINFYLEQTPPGVSKSGTWMRGTPGFKIRNILTTNPVTQLFYQNGRAFGIAGTVFYEFVPTLYEPITFQTIIRGSVATDPDGHAPTIVSNGSAGHQLFIVSGGNGYIFDTLTNILTQIADPGFPTGSAWMGEFMDGYFMVSIIDSRTFQISALLDGTSWDPLDVAERNEGSDNIVTIIRSHREIWLIGNQTTEVWFDSGDPDFPFQPIQGVFVEQGGVRAFTCIRLDNTILWVGLNVDGHGIVWRAKGYTPDRISTYAVEWDIQHYGFEGARAWGYQEVGHLFYVLLLPDAPWTWVYDLSNGSWHKRAGWDSTECVWVPYRAQCHMFAFNKHIVGDRSNGAMYEMSTEFFDEQRITVNA